MARTVDEIELRHLLRVGPETSPATPYTDNARYLSSIDGFNIKRPPVPPHVFRAERDRALDPGARTGLYPLDLAGPLGLPSPATTPLALSRYLRIRAGESVATELAASTEFYYVLAGRGTTHLAAGERPGTVAWAPGDVFCLPGGGATRHRAGEDAVLWLTTDEPALAYLGLQPPAAGQAPFRPAHYPAGEIRRRLLGVYLDSRGGSMAGKSVNFGNAGLEAARTTAPTLMLALNSLLPGEAQRGHRHNAVAVTLVVAGRGCYSLIDGQRVDWEPDAVMITPPGTFHSHHNDGDEVALFLIVQDGGLYYHARTMGFSWD
jgi:gentisate 1,2-dioxygenase